MFAWLNLVISKIINCQHSAESPQCFAMQQGPFLLSNAWNLHYAHICWIAKKTATRTWSKGEIDLPSCKVGGKLLLKCMPFHKFNLGRSIMVAIIFIPIGGICQYFEAAIENII